MMELLLKEKLPQALQALCERLNKYVQKNQEKKNIAEEQAAKIILNIRSLPFTMIMMMTRRLEDSLSMRDEHLSTNPEKESDKVIKYSIENLIPIPKLNSEIPDAIIESFSPSPIPVEDSDSLMEEIDIFLAPDETRQPPTTITEQCTPNYDIERAISVLTTKVVDDISDNLTKELYVHVPNVLPTLPTLYPVFDTLLPFSSENEDKVFNPEFSFSNEEKILLIFYLVRLLIFSAVLIF
ncbi:hypothetical protein Tco_1569459 [Tanacetum coccineum]